MKTVLQTTSASLVFSPGAPGVGYLDFSRIYDTIPFSINRLMVVINQTRNQVIYAETQTGFGYTNWNLNTRRLFLACDTSTHSAFDTLQAIYDVPASTVTPAEEYYDPVNKLRTSSPQTLIDTDFEYGIQPTKWEFLFQENNRPNAFYDASVPLNITNITGAGTRAVTITVASTVNIFANTPIFVQETTDANANGWFVVETGPGLAGGTTFTYLANQIIPTGSIFDSARTFAFSGTYYQSSGIPVAANAFSGTTTITCTTTGAHGLARGSQVFLANTTSTPTVVGPQIITSVPTANTFTFVPYGTAPAAAPTNSAGNNVVYPRGDGYVIHRPFDGGVQITSGTRAGSGSPYSSVVRQTRKYFRYQSGKGIQFSTGSVLRPALNVNRVVASGTGTNAPVSVTTKNPHGLTVGSNVSVSGSTDQAFNGVFQVTSTPDDLTFTYNTVGAPANAGDAPAPSPMTIYPEPQYGSTVRVGMFDHQNGMFFENDGVNTFVVRRNSTLQLTGLVSVAGGSNLVTGTGTLFSAQLNPADFVVIRGMSYKVLNIISDTQMVISPEWRGPVGIQNAVISKTVDTKTVQSEWNIDTMDGRGPSNYNMDPRKMQMLYMDYSWYGAGFIRFGVRGQNGNVTYFHKMVNNNVNNEAYLRSGNLPARYESANTGPISRIAATINSGDTSITLPTTRFWPSSGIVKVTAPGQTGVIEYMLYRGTNSTQLLNIVRPQMGGQGTPQTFTFSNNAPTAVEFVGVPGSGGFPQANAVSHWGSSVIMDGRFDDDSQFVFNVGTPDLTIATANTRAVLLALRLAPSVDSGRTGVLGAREIINRMQLKLRSMDTLISVTGTGACGGVRIECVLNGRVQSGQMSNFTSVGGSSLAQVAYPANAAVRLEGGENVFGFFAPGGNNGVAQQNQQDLSAVRELSNSILGGATTVTVPTVGGTTPTPTSAQAAAIGGMFPDGPDIIYIVASPVTNSTTVRTRVSWVESQA